MQTLYSTLWVLGEEIVLGLECHDRIFLDHQPTTPGDPHLSLAARKEKSPHEQA